MDNYTPCNEIKELQKDIQELKTTLREKNVRNGYTNTKIQKLEAADEDLTEKITEMTKQIIKLQNDVQSTNKLIQILYKINITVIISVFTSLALLALRFYSI
ncbi:MAG TPA: hypothetical protein PKU94_07820 [Candidatus Hydrothermia bacterium]|nr:hypothetical protein [Candidatus Hydrothermia bacterium]